MKKTSHLPTYIFSIIFLCINIKVSGTDNHGQLSGKVTDKSTGEALVGVNINVQQRGTTTGLDGDYTISLPAGAHEVRFSYLGYVDQNVNVVIEAGAEVKKNISMLDESRELNIVVVSASKYEKPLGEETVSIEILRPEFIESSNPLNLQESLNKITGLNVVGEQVNIRGGSGYSAGAASRVLILLDDMPMLGPDNGTADWNALPLENIEQIEVIKGAASSLYGSSALNGIVNVRTASPRSEPYTKITTFAGIYDNPSNEDMIWWEKDQPLFNGFSMAHRRRAGNLDIVLGGNYLAERSYLQDNNYFRLRGNAKLRYRFEQVEGLTAGLDVNMMLRDGETFFVWAGKDSLALVPFQSNELRRRHINIDPYLTYFDSNNNRHSLRSRFYSTQGRTNTTENSDAELYYGEYTFTRLMPDIDLNFTTGTSGSYTNVVSETFNDHTGWNAALFAQIDKKFFNRLTLNFGARYEYFGIDDEVDNSGILLRGGANLQLTEGTYFRGSYGKGYRYPTIAEKFVETTRGGINVYPNPDLNPESGWSAEVGVKQMFSVSNWVGYIDASAFLTEYRDMIEFTFVTQPGIGFQSINISDARISGFEFSGFGTGDIFGIPTNLIFGYTYINPVDLIDTTDTGEREILHYRFRHSAKGDIETTYRNITFGVTGTYSSFMERIDPAFSLISGLQEYREENNTGNVVLDARIGYDISKGARVLFIVKNMLNNEYTTRPAFIEPPRNFTVQLSYEF